MAKHEKQQGVAVVASSEASAAVELFKQQHTDLVQVRQEIMGIPRLKLMQKGTGSVGVLGKPGDFICDLKDKNYGTSVDIICLFVNESASLMKEGEKLPICKTNNMIFNQDGVKCVNCPHDSFWDKWTGPEGNVPPECKKSIDVFCLVGEDMEPMFLSFRNMSYKAGQKLVQKLGNDNRVVCDSTYTLSSKDGTSKGYDYKLIDENIKQTQLTDAELLKVLPIANKFLDMKKRGNLKREEEEPPASEDVPL